MAQRRIRTPKETFDDPWKQIVTALFEQFVAFFAPDAWSEIDWDRPPVFLDKELRRVAKGLRKRRVTADFLVKVWRKDGTDMWLLAHIELQAQRDVTFPVRMFRYNTRAFDLFQRPVYSLAILADSDPTWRPNHFGYGSWGSSVELNYPVRKLIDYADRQAELEASSNPFALAVLVHLKTLETRGDAEARLAWKIRLLRTLVGRRWQRKEIEELLQFLDWIMSLPEALEVQYDAQWEAMERDQTMAQTMPPALRRAEAIGGLKSQRRTLVRLMQLKFGRLTSDLEARIELIADTEVLDELHASLLTANAPEEMPFPRD